MSETNYEHYKDEIIEAFRNGWQTSPSSMCKFVKKHLHDCRNILCNECAEKIAEWLNEEYKNEIDWSKVPVDMPVICTNTTGVSFKRHFKSHNDNYVYVFTSGCSSWTADGVETWNKDLVTLPEDIIDVYSKN